MEWNRIWNLIYCLSRRWRNLNYELGWYERGLVRKVSVKYRVCFFPPSFWRKGLNKKGKQSCQGSADEEWRFKGKLCQLHASTFVLEKKYERLSLFSGSRGTWMKCEKSPEVMSPAKNKSIKTVRPSSIRRLVCLRLLPSPLGRQGRSWTSTTKAKQSYQCNQGTSWHSRNSNYSLKKIHWGLSMIG